MMEHTLINHFIAVVVGTGFTFLPAKVRAILSGIALNGAVALLVLAIVNGYEMFPFIGTLIIVLTIFMISVADLMEETREKRELDKPTWTDSWSNSWVYKNNLYKAELEYTESGVLFHQYEQVDKEDLFPPLPIPTLGHTLAQELSLTISWLDLENKYEDNDIDQRAL